MITVKSGIMKIPENERFIGFEGDNLRVTRQFLVSPAEEDTVFKLFLTFDDGTCNFFLLDTVFSDGGATLTWNIRKEHIFKSGVVTAQLKMFSRTGELIRHSSTDRFTVGGSAEFSEHFENGRNTEFLAYEKKLLDIMDDIQNTLPYIGEDGYWYLFDAQKEEYVKSGVSALAGVTQVDGALSDESENPVANRALTEKFATVMDLAPSIGAQAQITALDRGQVYIFQGHNVGVKTSEAGVSGHVSLASMANIPQNVSDLVNDMDYVSSAGIPYFLEDYAKSAEIPKKTSDLENDSGFLTQHQDVSGKMALTPVIDNPGSIPALADGQIFRCQGSIALRSGSSSDGYVELAKKSELSAKADASQIPAKTSDLTNDSGFVTSAQVQTLINTAIGGIENGTY